MDVLQLEGMKEMVFVDCPPLDNLTKQSVRKERAIGRSRFSVLHPSVQPDDVEVAATAALALAVAVLLLPVSVVRNPTAAKQPRHGVCSKCNDKMTCEAGAGYTWQYGLAALVV